MEFDWNNKEHREKLLSAVGFFEYARMLREAYEIKLDVRRGPQWHRVNDVVVRPQMFRANGRRRLNGQT